MKRLIKYNLKMLFDIINKYILILTLILKNNIINLKFIIYKLNI